MIAETTRRLLGSDFVIETIGERRLKGHDQPVPLFRARARERNQGRLSARGEADPGPIFGREAELAALRCAWEEAKSGNGPAALVSGEAGIGKSRLLQALADTIVEDKPVLQVLQCSPLHSDNPFWPVVQQCAAAAAIVERGANEVNGQDRPEIRRKTIDALAALLLERARGGPTLLVAEDAQWADGATTALLQHLFTAVSKAPMPLIVTSRPEGERRLAATTQVLRIALPRLKRSAAIDLLAAIAGRHRLARRTSAEILARSDGIPLFIEEMTKAVIETAPAERRSRSRRRSAIR